MQSLLLFPVQTAAHLTHQVVSSSLLMHDYIYVELKAFIGEVTSTCPFTFVKACFRNTEIKNQQFKSFHLMHPTVFS